MSGIQTYLLELLSMFSESHAMIVGGLLSPAKLGALMYGLYKAVSPHYVKPMQPGHQRSMMSEHAAES